MKPATLAGLLSLLFLASCGKQEAPSHEEIIAADLAEILALQGSPCGEVVAYTLDERLDYRIECKSGNVYRLHVSSEGHVMVKPSGP